MVTQVGSVEVEVRGNIRPLEEDFRRAEARAREFDTAINKASQTADGGMQKAEKSVVAFERALDKTSKAATKVSSNTAAFVDNIGASVGNAERTVGALDNTLSNAAQSVDEFNSALAEGAEQAEATGEASNALAEANKEVERSTVGVVSETDKASASTRELVSANDNLKSSISDATRQHEKNVISVRKLYEAHDKAKKSVISYANAIKFALSAVQGFLGALVLTAKIALGVIGALSGAFVLLGLSGVGAAAGLKKMEDRFTSVFGNLSGAVKDWAATHAEAIGKSRVDLQQYLITLQDTFVPMGFAAEEAAKFSRAITELSLDVAAFKNASDSDVLEAFRSAMLGNVFAVRRYGVVITDAKIQTELFALGINKNISNATDAQKALARLNIAVRESEDSFGAAKNEVTDFANRISALRTEWQGLVTDLGKLFLPSVSSLLPHLTEFVKDVRAAVAEIKQLAFALGLLEDISLTVVSLSDDIKEGLGKINVLRTSIEDMKTSGAIPTIINMRTGEALRSIAELELELDKLRMGSRAAQNQLRLEAEATSIALMEAARAVDLTLNPKPPTDDPEAPGIPKNRPLLMSIALPPDVKPQITDAQRAKDAIDAVVASLKFQREQLGRTERAQMQYNVLQQAGITVDHERAGEIMALAGALYDLEQATDAARDAQEDFDYALEDTMRSGLDVFKGLISGTMDWKDALLSMIPIIIDLIQKFIALKIAKAALEAAGGTPTAATGGLLGGIIIPGILHGGGGQQDAVYNRAVPASTFAGAPRLHDGMAGDEFPAILQQGEMVIPKDFGSQFLLMLEELSKLFIGFGDVSDNILKSALEANAAVKQAQNETFNSALPASTSVKTISVSGSSDMEDTFNASMNSAAGATDALTRGMKGAAEEAFKFTGFFTEAGRKIMENPLRVVSTELQETVEDPRGGFMNVPTLFNGQPVSTDEALDRIIDAGFRDPETNKAIQSYASITAAENASKANSASLDTDVGVQAAFEAQEALRQVSDAGNSAAAGLNSIGTSAADMINNPANDEAYAKVEASLDSVDTASATAASQLTDLGAAATSASQALSSVKGPDGGPLGIPNLPAANDNKPDITGAEDAATGLAGVFQKITSTISSFISSIFSLGSSLDKILASLIDKILSSLLSAIPFFHEGTDSGPTYKQGSSLKPDEYLAVLQTGEKVIPRGGNDNKPLANDGMMRDAAPRAPNVGRTIETSAAKNDNNPASSGAGGASNDPQSTKIINVLDPAIVGDYLATEPGERLIMNVLRRNNR